MGKAITRLSSTLVKAARPQKPQSGLAVNFRPQSDSSDGLLYSKNNVWMTMTAVENARIVVRVYTSTPHR